MSKARRKQIFSAFFLQQGAEWSAASAEMLACSGSGGTLLVLERPCWFVLFLRSEIKKFLVKTAEVLWQKRKQIQEITNGVQFQFETVGWSTVRSRRMLCVRTVGCERMSASSLAGLSLRSQWRAWH